VRHASSRPVSSLRPLLKPILILIALLAASMGAGPAMAQANSKYAAIVIDANTGKTLFAANANARRYPASLTKMMTLYLTFEALQTGRIGKDSKIVFSRNASAEAPTKLGVRAGGTITVETAILALITKSANDAATALAETLGGSEENFARIMTAKARALGMKGTVFRNAHGLPNPGQFTTAQDMATLGLALNEHFPQYYDYFSVRSFQFGKQRIAGHNRLLGRVKGVDGIKTGYTRASGFNLATSASDGNRRIVAVVLGGTSGGARDKHMTDLVGTYLPKASPRGGGNLVARAATAPLNAIAKVILPKKNAPTPDSRPGADEVQVASADENILSLAEEQDVQVAAAVPAPVKAPAEAPAPAAAPRAENLPFAYSNLDPARLGGVDPVKTASVPSKGAWAVQVASSPSQSEAKAFLDRTSGNTGGVLDSASAYTVPFVKGGVTYYRARFGGFETKTAAWDACNALKRRKISCYAVQQ
jgi:D-alanyl-D-alanine carboxypeptidase